MKKYGNVDDVRRELAGKTGLLPEYEEVLFESIVEIEQDSAAIPDLTKTDWILIGVMLAASAILAIICFTWV